MDDEPTPPSDPVLKRLGREDLSTLSVEDLEERIAALEAELTRCRQAVGARGDSRAAAESLFR